MRYPVLINDSDNGVWCEPLSIQCNDMNWRSILSGARWQLDFLGEFKAGAAQSIYNEICRFVFPGALTLSLTATAAGLTLYSSAQNAVPVLISDMINEPWEFLRVEYINQSMRASIGKWPQWSPLASDNTGQWADVSSIWPGAPMVLIQIGPGSNTLSAGTAPMWTVQTITLSNGVSQ